MVFEIREINDRKLNQAYEDSMNELNSFFELNWKHNRPNLIIVPNRKTIDSLRGERTDGWLTGWASNKDIYLLCPENFEKESSHKYSDESYFALLKHELAHHFSRIISRFTQKPVWLFEGVSMFLSGQNKQGSKPERLKKFIGFYDKYGKEMYQESGFAVEFLVEKYGKEKLIEMLKRSKEADSDENFARLFKSIYGFELTYEKFKVL
ncbi:MAG: hypothetical protein Q8N63_08235 [Nanoarchaeota archaeon]|nr:hypothetical protein [Nanoarchaeota archaeon]